MSAKKYDEDLMKAAARKLDTAGANIDSHGDSAPSTVNAGPYTEECAAILKVLLDASGEMAIRLRMAAVSAEQAKWNIAATETVNMAELERLRKQLEGE